MLLEESAISPDVVAERGYETITRRDQLAEYPEWQRRLGLYVPMLSPSGERGCQIRPDRPRRDGPKYETPHGSQVIADVHPRMMEEVRHGSGELFITEGAKTGDAMTSRGLPTVVLAGVWNFAVKGTHGKQLLPCFDHIRLEDRRVTICYDADVMVNAGVQLALQRFVEALEDRGAEVYMVYLPEPENKTGADDYFAAGHTVSEFKALFRRFEPADIGEIRLSQDAGLQAAIDSAWSSWYAFDWNRLVGTGDRPNWMRGHSARDVEKVAIDTATKSGVPVEDGLYFSLNARSWAEAAASRKQTILSSIDHLEAEGRIRRDKPPEEGKAAGYVLLTAKAPPRASPYQNGKREAVSESLDSSSGVAFDHTGTDLRAPYSPSAPRLRWSAPKFTRIPEGGWERDYIRRLGKHNGALIDHLERAGGSLEASELAGLTNKRTRDLRRRNLPLLEERGIIAVEGDTVSLVSGWLAALTEERRISGELDADLKAEGDHARQREAFRRRHENPADPAPTEADMDAARAEREHRRQEDRERPVSPLAAAMHSYLLLNPHNAGEPAGWIGKTLWAFGLYEGNPTPAESKAAIAELGGERYVREHLVRGEPEPVTGAA